MMMRLLVATGLVAMMLVWHPCLSGAQGTDDSRIQQLEQQLQLIQRELEALKQQRMQADERQRKQQADDAQRLQNMQRELSTLHEERVQDKAMMDKAMMAKDHGPKFPFGIDFGASITVRYDITEVEDREDIRLEDNEIEGFRTRDRFWATYHPDGPVHAGLRLTTGGRNPTSPFVRMGDVFRDKSFELDEFYLAVHPLKFFDETPLEAMPFHVTLLAGKMPQPFWLGNRGGWSSEMIWDADVSPEGMVLKLAARKLLPGLSIESTTGYFIIEEVDDLRFAGLTADTYLVATQLKIDFKPAALAFTFYDYENLNAGLRVPSLSAGGAFIIPGQSAILLRPGLHHTNSQISFGQGANGFIDDNFQIINVTGQVALGIPGMPSLAPEIFLVGDYINNLSVDDDNLGYGVTIGLRGGGQQGSGVNAFNFWFTYRDVDNDATLATFADSDLGAGTGYRGIEVGGNYRLHRNLLFQIVYVDFEGFPAKGNEITRVFFDLVATF